MGSCIIQSWGIGLFGVGSSRQIYKHTYCKLKYGSGAVLILSSVQTRGPGKLLYHAFISVSNPAIMR